MELVMTGSDALDLSSGGVSSTFFVPTDAAFEELGGSTIQDALKNRALLKTVSCVLFSFHQNFVSKDGALRSWPTMSSRDYSTRTLSDLIWSTSCLPSLARWPYNGRRRSSRYNFLKAAHLSRHTLMMIDDRWKKPRSSNPIWWTRTASSTSSTKSWCQKQTSRLSHSSNKKKTSRRCAFPSFSRALYFSNVKKITNTFISSPLFFPFQIHHWPDKVSESGGKHLFTLLLSQNAWNLVSTATFLICYYRRQMFFFVSPFLSAVAYSIFVRIVPFSLHESPLTFN